MEKDVRALSLLDKICHFKNKAGITHIDVNKIVDSNLVMVTSSGTN